MGATGSKIAKNIKQKEQTGERLLDGERMKKLIAGLTYRPSNRTPHQIHLPNEKDNGKFALSCYTLFSQDECQALVDLTNSLGYKKGSQSRGIPKATNVTLNSNTISDLLWERIQKYVPDQFKGKRVIGLDEKVRFLKYDPIDEECGLSKDTAVNWLAIGKYPLSVVVFLSDDYEGGEVMFPDTSTQNPPTHLPAPVGHVMILEDSVVSHSMPITKGTKYVMRVDVMTEEGESSDDLLMAAQDTLVDTMHQISLSELNNMELQIFSPKLAAMPSLPTVGEFQLNGESQTVLAECDVAPGPDGCLPRTDSLPRSDCSHEPMADNDEMARGSFRQRLNEFHGNQDAPAQALDQFRRQYSGRVTMDMPTLAAFPSLHTLAEVESRARHSTPSLHHLRSKRKMLPISGSTRMAFSTGEVNYPSLVSDELLRGE